MEEALLLSGWEDSDGSSVWLSPPEGLWLSGREEGEEGAEVSGRVTGAGGWLAPPWLVL